MRWRYSSSKTRSKSKEELGDRAGISASLHQIAMIYQASGNHEEALDYYQRALKIAEELKDHMGIASTRGQNEVVAISSW
ncbi:MAG: tetratricopeptide repeat protein [Acidobacteriota bacterium]